MVVIEGVQSLCRVTVALFGWLPGVPEGLQVFGVSQVHSWWGVCLVHGVIQFVVVGWVLCRLFLSVFGGVCCLTSV